MPTISPTGDEDDFAAATGVDTTDDGALVAELTGAGELALADDGATHLGTYLPPPSRMVFQIPGSFVASEPSGFTHVVGTFAVNAAYASGTPNPS
jgi:hypothetical protein